MSKDKDKEWMHFSGHKTGAEKMMMSAPKIEDFTRNYGRPGERADTIDHDAYGRAISGHAASMASGSWMTAKTSAGGRDGEEVYRHPHLAALAEKGYTFNDIQSAGNRLGLTSFNSKNDAGQIEKLLDEREGAYARGLVDSLRKEQGEKGPEDAKPYTPSKELRDAVNYVEKHDEYVRMGQMNPFATGSAQKVTTSMNFDTRADELGAERSDVKAESGVEDTANTSPLDDTGVKFGGTREGFSQKFKDDYAFKVKKSMRKNGVKSSNFG
jgi:hypothetical protein